MRPAAYTMIRSIISRKTNKRCHEQRGDHRRGNQHYEAGKQGERVLKSKQAKQNNKGSNKEAKAADERIVGKTPRAKCLLDTIIEHYNRVQQVEEFKERRKENKQVFIDNTKKASQVRCKTNLEKFTSRKDIECAPTAAEKPTDVDVTGAASNMIQFSDLRAGQHKAGVIEELSLRGITVKNLNERWDKLRDMFKGASTGIRLRGPQKFFSERVSEAATRMR